MFKYVKNEKGSALIEFLGMLPFVFLILLIFLQFLVAGYALFVSQSAVNEAAKTYAITGDIEEARLSAQEFIDNTGGNIEFDSMPDPIRNNKNFELTLNIKFKFIFLPEKLFGEVPPIIISRTISGRVME
ncbi:pilus assembly protein [Ureibacillus thermosphaericus]|uniref:pilus assembly protein n=1 Tax=Ureibacillus thermosphaericus TaxID=51173 RepID=UPI0030C925B8